MEDQYPEETAIDNYLTKIGADKETYDNWFVRFVVEVVNMSGMPDEVSMRIWPIAALYAARHYDIQKQEQ